MIFGTLMRRAQHSVDTAVSHAINKVLIALPFVVAAGFGTAALSLRLNRELGPEIGNLVLAGIFCLVGLIAAFALRTRADHPAVAEPQAATSEEKVQSAASEPMTPADRELLMAALTTAAPIALPGILRILLRNLPLLAVVVALGYVFLYGTSSPAGGDGVDADGGDPDASATQSMADDLQMAAANAA